MFLRKYTDCALNCFSLVSIKTCGMNIFFKLRLLYTVIVFASPVFPKNVRRDKIHALVRALRRKNCRNEKFKRVGVVKRAAHVRVFALQTPYNQERALTSLFAC